MVEEYSEIQDISTITSSRLKDSEYFSLVRKSFEDFITQKRKSTSYRKTMSGIDWSLKSGTITTSDAFQMEKDYLVWDF